MRNIDIGDDFFTNLSVISGKTLTCTQEIGEKGEEGLCFWTPSQQITAAPGDLQTSTGKGETDNGFLTDARPCLLLCLGQAHS